MFAHPFPFDPTYGYDLPALLRVPPAPEPPDFADFWRSTYTTTRAIDPQATLRPSAHRVVDFEIFDVSYISFGHVRVGGWIALPLNRPVRRGLVISHGYGGREGPDS